MQCLILIVKCCVFHVGHRKETARAQRVQGVQRIERKMEEDNQHKQNENASEIRYLVQ